MDANRFESVATKAASDTSPLGQVDAHLQGEVIADRYKLRRELGRGGMGVVWAADSLALGVEVAIKLIHSDVASTATIGRMMREAQTVARISHPSLVRVFDFGFTSRHHPYLVMELVRGETLRDQLGRDLTLPAIEAVRTLLPIADGLRTAHENGIVHRDLKPDNVFLARDGLNRLQPKLMDFGIAKDAAATSKLTQTGFVIGTPQYISPEQAKGLDSVDARSDVWSFCVMLYELLTGRLPFEEDNYNAQLYAIIERPPAQPKRRPGDARLWQIVLHGLAKEPSERFQTIGELGEILAAWLYDHGVKVDVSGNSLRTVWLDNAKTRNSVSPLAKPLHAQKPRMGSGNSRIPPGRASSVRGAGLVLAVAASVFGLFELTFAKPTSSQTPLLAAGAVQPYQALESAPYSPADDEGIPKTGLTEAPKPQGSLVDTRLPKATAEARKSATQALSFGTKTPQPTAMTKAVAATRLTAQGDNVATTPHVSGTSALEKTKRRTNRAKPKKQKAESPRHDFGF